MANEVGIEWRGAKKRIPLTLLAALGSLLSFLSVVALFAGFSTVIRGLRGAELVDALVPSFAGLFSVTLLASCYVFVLAKRQTRGTWGRGRLLTLASSTIALLLFAAPATFLALHALHQATVTGLALTFELEEVLLALEAPYDQAPLLLLVPSGVAALPMLGGLVGAWFLLSERVRVVFWAIADFLLAGGLLFTSLTMPLLPGEDGDFLVLAALRLTFTTSFTVRLVQRFVSPVLGLIERLGFRPLVAARHLRSRKSGFLATIGALSILAVALSSCMLTTVLSVMGGFRNDLKRKILGNSAHVVIDREHDSFEGWEPTLEVIRGAPGVTAASPFVTGEVMVTSASNMAGAVLRGIDPSTIGDVTDLRANLTRGRLEYLVEPERLLDLPPEERRTILPLRIQNPRPDSTDDGGAGESEAATADGGTPSREDRQATGLDPPSPIETSDELEAFLKDATRDAAQGRDVLPGIIVGQELARTLRLYLGDEIDVISPLGELGPAGPMPKSRTYRVAGIFYSGMYEYDMKMVYVTLDTAQRFLSTGDAISGIEIKVEDVERAPATAASVREAVGRSELRVRDWQEMNSQLFGALELEKLAMFVTLGIAILIAGFCVFGTLTLMVQEKSREVGVLKAMGTSKGAVVGIFLLEGFIIGVLGAAIGLGLGFLAAFGAENFGIKMNPEVYYIDRLPVAIDATEFGLVGLAAVAVCLVATVFPAWLASQLRPVDALRYE